MSAPRSVQGVQGCAGLCFSTRHTLNQRIPCAVGFCAGCAGLSGAQAYAHSFFFEVGAREQKKDYASTQKGYTPCTPYTKQCKRLIYIGFICVGFVLGWVFSVLGSVFRGKGR